MAVWICGKFYIRSKQSGREARWSEIVGNLEESPENIARACSDMRETGARTQETIAKSREAIAKADAVLAKRK
jgi:hypothetical protein